MQVCPVRMLAHKYDRLAKHWLETEDDQTFDKMGELAISVDELKPESITGAAFLISCAISEMDLVVGGGDAPHIRLASERRVLRLLRRAFLYLEDHSDELPSAWEIIVPAGDRQLLQMPTDAPLRNRVLS